MIFRLLITACLTVILNQSVFASDPILPDAPDYREYETVGGEGWSAGDTFLAITLPLAIIVTIALPLIFDGLDEKDYKPWPIEKFKLAKNDISMFPTRSTCIDSP